MDVFSIPDMSVQWPTYAVYRLYSTDAIPSGIYIAIRCYVAAKWGRFMEIITTDYPLITRHGEIQLSILVHVWCGDEWK